MNKKKVIEFINNIKSTDKVIHLSHNDMDGFGSSYMVKKYLDCNLIQGNTDYGKILSKLEELGIEKNDKVIITDLNLTIAECNLLNSTTTNWMVIDHHITGESSAKLFNNNYYLNTEYCATYLIHDILHNSNASTDLDKMKEIAELVNAYDLWHKESLLFKKGMLLSYYIHSMLFEFNNLQLKYTEWLFDNIAVLLLISDVENTELNYNKLFRHWIMNINDSETIKDNFLPTNIKCAIMHVDGIEKYIVHSTDNYIIFSGLSSKVTQYAFDELFNDVSYKDKVLINLNSKGKCTFRSVNEKSKTYATLCGGGGHPNAAGCNLNEADGSYLKQLIEILKYES